MIGVIKSSNTNKLICGKIGQIITYQDTKLRVEECGEKNLCDNCYFNNKQKCAGKGIVSCVAKWRPDKKSVKFVKVI